MEKNSGKKNKVAAKEVRKVGRPKLNKVYVEIGLRVTPEERDILRRGAAAEAKRLGITTSRNGFCLRASMVAARKELRDT